MPRLETHSRLSLVSLLSLLLMYVAMFFAPLVLVAQPHEHAGELTADAMDAEPAENSGEGEEKDTWDVENPPIPSKLVTVDTTSGTWMSLDVSPDGSEIVFDLLGDLYRLPVDGGEATAITSGLAWDMQPRYSPDGEWIAFTSDRAGGDNLWIIRPDGSDAQQVSSESFRLLNSPAWSPDGDWIAARKHYTARRSMGAGEIWLFHRSGEGQGLRMTDKPNDQKDVGEPAFSPDGRFVYFSQDTTPGEIFEYNKDPNGQIYTIQRLDRETGLVEALITGAGGAVRPTPSPDGKTLAFVRRIREKTALVVRDLESGRDRIVAEDLERDLQETWAVHGVYPSMAWTPDGEDIVYWAKGELHRVNVASRQVRTIPFHVRQEHRLLEAVRFPVEVAPERFPVRMLRWVQVSPDGKRVVFQALGRLWIRDLPEGEPRRLTDQETHQELHPSWSRDGKQIVFTTWSTADLSTIRIADVPRRGAATSRAVTSTPGHWLDPVLSPDGRTVVATKTAGSWLTSRLYGTEPGLYEIDLGSGSIAPPIRISTQGSRPHFGASSDRVFAQVTGPEERSLVSIPLAGTAADLQKRDPRTHATSDHATELRVSPDGRWIAFRERYQVWVTPFVATGRPVAIGPKMDSAPAMRVAQDAGSYLHWSGDSTRLHWVLGPELYTRDLQSSFAFLPGAPEELPEATSEGLDVGFEATTARVEGVVVFEGARVLTMKGDEDEEGGVIDDGVVVVHDDRIVAVGRRDEVEIPTGARRFDVTGHTLLPGLVDVHWHGGQGADGVVPERNWQNDSSLAFGVTTIHDPSTDTGTFFAAAEMAKAGLIDAPRLFSTGTILYGAEASFRAIVDSLEDARFHVGRLQKQGAISVKSYNQPRRDQRQQILAAARELGMMVVPEGGSLFTHNMTMVLDGHTGVEHALPLADVYDDVVQLWSQSEVGYTPTLVVGYGGVWGENYWYAKTDVWAHERLLRFTPRELVDPVARRPFLAPDAEYNHFEIAETAKELRDAGVSIQLGAHGQREGLGAHWELWMLEQGGMTPHEALQAATRDGAAYVGLDGDIGTLEPGKLADLIVVEGDLLDDLRRSDDVLYTMVGGRLWDAATMDQILPVAKTREPYGFESDGLEGAEASP